jgi:hypothetical protein
VEKKNYFMIENLNKFRQGHTNVNSRQTKILMSLTATTDLELTVFCCREAFETTNDFFWKHVPIFEPNKKAASI